METKYKPKKMVVGSNLESLTIKIPKGQTKQLQEIIVRYPALNLKSVSDEARKAIARRLKDLKSEIIKLEDHGSGNGITAEQPKVKKTKFGRYAKPSETGQNARSSDGL